MVAKLLEELQSVTVRENLLNVSVIQPQSSREKVAQGPAISGDSLDHSPPIVASNDSGCISPNRFLLLQDVREEGEIDEEHVEDRVDELDNLVEEVGAAKYLISKPSVVATKQTSSQRSRALMSSIFAWNMREFNMPRKQKAVKYWVKAAKLSLGCLLETRVHEDNFQEVFDATFPGWSYIHNYSHHRLGRIWATGDTFLCSFIYASNCAIERRELWNEMELVSRSVAGDQNPWIIQGDFNVALTEQEHSRFMETRLDRSSIRDFQNVVLKCDMVDLAQ
ncbi:hypothetical protein HID58_048075, partial [Brassica napus]